jgi:hypothetical protein
VIAFKIVNDEQGEGPEQIALDLTGPTPPVSRSRS